MRTYAEANSMERFDWNAFLNKEVITDEEWHGATTRAKSWITCACGNQCEIISRDPHGQPYDKMLVALGGNTGFYNAIESKNKKLAKHYLKLIEIHSQYLIEQEVTRRINFLKIQEEEAKELLSKFEKRKKEHEAFLEQYKAYVQH